MCVCGDSGGKHHNGIPELMTNTVISHDLLK